MDISVISKKSYVALNLIVDIIYIEERGRAID